MHSIKTCSKCKTNKPSSEFYRSGRTSDGLRSWCKICDLESNKKQRQSPDYNEKKRDRNKRYYAIPEVRERILEKSKKYRRRHHLKSKYGLTEKSLSILKKSQDFKCAICLCDFDKEPCVDHDHKTGVVRGLLCSDCNLGLGMFKDDPKSLVRASKYLTRERNEHCQASRRNKSR